MLFVSLDSYLFLIAIVNPRSMSTRTLIKGWDILQCSQTMLSTQDNTCAFSKSVDNCQWLDIGALTFFPELLVYNIEKSCSARSQPIFYKIPDTDFEGNDLKPFKSHNMAIIAQSNQYGSLMMDWGEGKLSERYKYIKATKLDILMSQFTRDYNLLKISTCFIDCAINFWIKVTSVKQTWAKYFLKMSIHMLKS